MAKTVREAANIICSLLEKEEVCIDGAEKLLLVEHGIANICGYNCKIVNVRSLSSCRALVNTSWFSRKGGNYSKPRMKQGSNNSGIDFQLIPTKDKILAIHYLDLRQYALFLEEDRDQWFRRSYWGMQIIEEEESFIWKGGNAIKFPLCRVTQCGILHERDREIFETVRRP